MTRRRFSFAAFFISGRYFVHSLTRFWLSEPPPKMSSMIRVVNSFNDQSTLLQSLGLSSLIQFALSVTPSSARATAIVVLPSPGCPVRITMFFSPRVFFAKAYCAVRTKYSSSCLSSKNHKVDSEKQTHTWQLHVKDLLFWQRMKCVYQYLSCDIINVKNVPLRLFMAGVTSSRDLVLSVSMSCFTFVYPHDVPRRIIACNRTFS